MKILDQWLPVDAAAQETRKRGDVAKYRKLRDRSADDATGHLALAHWSSGAKLENEAQCHLIMAMQKPLTRKQAHDVSRKLGLVRYRGTIMLPAHANFLRRQAHELENDLKSWKAKIVAIRREAEGPDRGKRLSATERLCAINDVAAIPAMEEVVGKSTAELGKAMVAALAQMPEQEAVDSLVRVAVLSAHEDVRQAASEAAAPASHIQLCPHADRGA